MMDTSSTGYNEGRGGYQPNKTILRLTAVFVLIAVGATTYFCLSILGFTLGWRGERDLHRLYGAAGRGDLAAAERAVAPADRGRVAFWIDQQTTEHGRPSGIAVAGARTDAEFGEYGTILYRVRFPNGAEEHGSAFVRRGEPLALPPLTLERQIARCHNTVFDPAEITFGPFSGTGTWRVDYTVRRANGEERAYRASQGLSPFVVHALLPDGSRGPRVNC
jgi:hypothetical protein